MWAGVLTPLQGLDQPHPCITGTWGAPLSRGSFSLPPQFVSHTCRVQPCVTSGHTPWARYREPLGCERQPLGVAACRRSTASSTYSPTIQQGTGHSEGLTLAKKCKRQTAFEGKSLTKGVSTRIDRLTFALVCPSPKGTPFPRTAGSGLSTQATWADGRGWVQMMQTAWNKASDKGIVYAASHPGAHA